MSLNTLFISVQNIKDRSGLHANVDEKLVLPEIKTAQDMFILPALGSAYYDIAIRNTPVMEPITDESQLMKYKLVTLNDGVTAVPTINLNISSINVPRDFTGEILLSPSTNPTYNVTLGYTAILSNKNVGTLVVTETNSINSSTATIPTFAGDLASNTSQAVVGNKFRFIPNASLSKTTTTNITIIGNESGGNTAINVTVTVPTT